MRRILHIDMDAFFAAVEEKKRPELAGKPVVVGGSGDPTRRGVVSTCNYEARKFGIHSAMPLRTAYKLCPKAVFLPVDFEAYSRESERFKEVLGQVSPVMEDVGIDEAYLDISDIEMTPEEISRQIKDGIRQATGLTCTIGIAPNKLLAKIASDLRKPDGLTIITKQNLEQLIWPLAVRKLYGVGPKTEAALNAMGYSTIGELAARSKEELVGQFGESYGEYLYEAARGIDDSPLVTHWEPKSASRETTFERDVQDWQVLAKTLVGLVREVIDDIRERDYKARTVTVKIRYSDFITLTRAKTMEAAVDDEATIRKTAFECMKRFEFKKRVRLIGVRLSGLEKTGQGDGEKGRKLLRRE
ncbi:MAG: hypothetical protein A2X56_04320 [Nitrospirae bacterium GWC2_57_13]|jgi:DNA polymerase IV|nr:MAG: hypothetical protein A2X56_04320 [Nitrospirae bacterium GWC2_57_13]OGW44484.1 MAG: hypothetical protein A2X57_05920 [Nitrospirae bacterium GWD2_57_8]